MLSNIGATLKRKVKQTKYDRQKRRLAGSGVSCPICGANFREFATYGLNKRPNARCPGCRSLERDRLLWVYLQRRTGLLNPTAGIDQKIRLLHFAPEAHLYKQFATATHIDYTPVDFSPEKFADLVGSQGVEAAPAVVQGDILRLEFASSSFDFLICNHVLEHIEDDRQALSELFRVLAPGGSAIVMVPINYFDLPANHPASITYENAEITGSKERTKHFGQKDHVRIYGIDIVERLNNAGFQTEALFYAQEFTAEEQFKYGFKSDEIIFELHKPA